MDNIRNASTNTTNQSTGASSSSSSSTSNNSRGFSHYQNQNFNNRNRYNNNNNNKKRDNRTNISSLQPGGGAAQHYENWNANIGNNRNLAKQQQQYFNSIPNQPNIAQFVDQNLNANSNQNGASINQNANYMRQQKFNNNKKRSFSHKYNTNNAAQNENNQPSTERLNKSLNKDPSPNNSFSNISPGIPASISLDNFSNFNDNNYKNRTSPNGAKRSPTMTDSLNYFASSNSNSNQMFQDTIRQHGAISEDGLFAGQPTNEDTSFYSTPLNHLMPANYKVDPKQSPKSHTRLFETKEEIDARGGTHHHNHNHVHHSKDHFLSMGQSDLVVSSSSSSTSPEGKNSNEDEALVTASEGESSFGTIEPTIERTITNVAIETSFANEIERANAAINMQTISIKQYLDEKYPLVKETEASAEPSNDTTTTEESSSSSSGTIETSPASSTSDKRTTTATTSSSSLTSSSSYSSSGETKLPTTIITTTTPAQPSTSIEEQLKPVINYLQAEEEKQIASAHSSLTNLDSCGSCTTLNNQPATAQHTLAAAEINYSTQTNYPSSVNSDVSLSSRSSSSSLSLDKKREDADVLLLLKQEPKVDNFNVADEIAALVNKIVQEAISKAVRQQEAAAYTEIDINDMPSQDTESVTNQSINQLKNELIIEEPILEETDSSKAVINQEGVFLSVK